MSLEPISSIANNFVLLAVGLGFILERFIIDSDVVKTYANAYNGSYTLGFRANTSAWP